MHTKFVSCSKHSKYVDDCSLKACSLNESFAKKEDEKSFWRSKMQYMHFSFAAACGVETVDHIQSIHNKSYITLQKKEVDIDQGIGIHKGKN